MSVAPSMLGSESPHGGWHRGLIRRPAAVASPAATGTSTVVSPIPVPITPVMVVKVGGSLLSRPGWPALIESLVAAANAQPCCLVVGGGAVVDGLRAMNRSQPQAPQLMHDLAIDAMRLTARLVAAAVGLPLVSAPPDSRGVAVLDVTAWLAVGPRTATLPVGWHVTSDSIAASVAVEHGGSLLLAKSVPPPPCPDGVDPWSALARAGWVDEHFPEAAAPLATIEWAAPTA